MFKRYLSWSGAPAVMLITVALVVLDLSDGSVHRYWSRHGFTASVLSGLLVLLLTVLIVDRVVKVRQLQNQSRVIAAQAAIIVTQAGRAADLVARRPLSAEDREQAAEELRTYAQMLLTSAPVMIDARGPRRFLEAAQGVAGLLFRSLQEAGDGSKPATTRLDVALQQLRAAAAPLLSVLNREQRVAVGSDEGDPG